MVKSARFGWFVSSCARVVAVILAAAFLVSVPVVDWSRAEPHPVEPELHSLPLEGVNAEALADAPEVPEAVHPHGDAHTNLPLAAAQEGGVTARSLAASGPEPTDEPAAEPNVDGEAEPVAMTAQQETEPFQLVGVTWKGARDDVSAWVRVRQDGKWSEWHELPTSDEHGPDPDSPEAASARGGTDPLVVAEADGVQVRVDAAGDAPAGLRVDLVDPGESAADAAVASQPPGSADAAPSRPSVYTRAQWGADESLRKGSPSYGTIQAGFVHHTVDANGYSQSQVPGIIRSIYKFHVNGRGWNDIGYNFLVDRFGRVWEGRYGGVDRPVIGAHTGGYNSGSFGMSAIGTYTSTGPSASTMNAYNRVFAWKLGLHGVDPTATTSISGKSFRTVSGHRDAGSTECPGQALYNKLPTIRSTAKSLQQAMLYGPHTSRTSWDYGYPGTTVSARVPMTQSYRLQIINECVGVVREFTGTASPSSSVSVVWNAKDSKGKLVPPGTYQAVLTSGTSTSQAYPYRVTFTIKATSGAPQGYCPPRLGGQDRYAVSVAVSKANNASTRSIVLASGASTTMGDALVAGPLARAKNAALLLTGRDALPASVSAEVKRRQATTAYLVGGPASVSSRVETQLRSLGVTSITRYGGADRYEVAAAVARAVTSSAPDAVVVSGQDAAFADGLTLSGPAARLRQPILLVTRDTVPAATGNAIRSLGVRRTVVGGGPATVSSSVMSRLPSPKRLGGADRFEVSANVAAWARSHMDVGDVLVASGRQQALADTLSGGQLGRPTLYVHEGGLPASVARWLDGAPDLRRVTVVGGPASVPPLVAGRAHRAVIT